ncbi:MAG: hypothetical protein OEV44_12950, partial [Spirochaetota bacterium]|nr:hypothetical protein [Spirochaetota bacterium]
MNKSIIIRVNAGNRFGFGHLSRCISLFKILNRDYDVQVVVLGVDEAKNILESQNIDYIFYKSDRDLIKLLNSKHVDLVITDIRDTKSSFTQKIRKYSKLLSIDDLGDGSNYSNLTVNTLPIPTTSKVKANFSGLKYLILNENLFRYRDKGIKKGSNILVSFGGEDPYGLTEFTTTLISNLAHTFNVKIVLGPLYKGKETFDNVQIIKSPDNFYEILCDSDLVICSFGITV